MTTVIGLTRLINQIQFTTPEVRLQGLVGTISLRLSDSDYASLTQNATEVSVFVRSLIQEAKRKDEERLLRERISENRKLSRRSEKNAFLNAN